MNKNKFKRYVSNKDLPCIMKWGYSAINVHMGSSASCYKTSQYKFNINDYGSFHNMPETLDQRQMMLDGIWPGDGCENCKRNENFNENSLRTKSNSFFNIPIKVENEKDLIPKETLQNPRNTYLTPKIIEVNFNNLCNMKCIYCSPINSRLLEEEQRRINNDHYEQTTKSYFLSTDEYDKSVNGFFDWFENNHTQLIGLYVLGGEPFLQKECFRLINFFNDNPSKNLSLNFFSNLKHNLVNFDDALNKINNLVLENKIKDVTICCSIDGWGQPQEYVRNGLKIEEWERNFSHLVLCYPKIKIRIHSTLCNLTLKSYPELLEKVIHYAKIRNKDVYHEKIELTHMFLETPDYLLLENFPPKFFDNDFSKIFLLLNSYEPFNQSIDEFKSYQRLINDHDNKYDYNSIQKLKYHLSFLDSIRNTNWRNIFPWLDDFDEDNTQFNLKIIKNYQ